MKIFLTKKADKELNRLPESLYQRVLKEITKLPLNPHPLNSKKLKGLNNYRLRIVSYRVIYTIDKKAKEIVILRVADRKTIYR